MLLNKKLLGELQQGLLWWVFRVDTWWVTGMIGWEMSRMIRMTMASMERRLGRRQLRLSNPYLI